SYFSICLRSDAVSLPARDMEDKKAQDDTWSNQQVHKTFPQNAVRVVGQPNTYVALWYHCGKPVMGRAWNDCGVMQCAFAVDQKAFTGMEVGNGTIQLLIYKGTHVQNHFYYDWITLSTWKSSNSENGKGKMELVHRESSAPIFWKERSVLGNYDIDSQKASFVDADKFSEVSDSATLANMLVLVRNTGGGPPGCPCTQCMLENTATQKPLVVNDWGDFVCGSPWPVDNAGHEFTGHLVGSMQMLVELPATAVGFEYCWLPYKEASVYMDKDFAPVHMSYVAPCVIQLDPYEILGKSSVTSYRCQACWSSLSFSGSVNLKHERAEVAIDGRVMTLEGPKIRELMVLCRKDRDDTMTI
uniref:DUF2804 domain-containing protein n=1 Tax=Haemonchus contortus TaxID=6289 RepID=A0A7I4XTJ8_HAECO